MIIVVMIVVSIIVEIANFITIMSITKLKVCNVIIHDFYQNLQIQVLLLFQYANSNLSF